MYTKVKKILCYLLIFYTFSVFYVGLDEVQASSDISISIDAGYEGKCKLGELNPIKVTLESKKVDLIGQLKIKISDREYIHDITQAKNTKKTFVSTLPIFKANQKIDVSFESGGEVLEHTEQVLQVLPQNSVFIGILSDEPDNLANLKSIDSEFISSNQIQVVNLEENLSSIGNTIDGINFIFIDNYNTGNLSKESQEQLKKWVAKGNLLIIGAEKYAYKNLQGMLGGLESKERIGNGYILPLKKDLENMDSITIGQIIDKNITSYGASNILQPENLKNTIEESKMLSSVADNNFQPSRNTLIFLISILILYLLSIILAIYLNKRYKWTLMVAIITFCCIFYVLALIGGFQKSKVVEANVVLHQTGNITSSLINVYQNKEANNTIQIETARYIDNFSQSSHQLDSITKKITFTDSEKASFYLNSYQLAENIIQKLTLSSDLRVAGEIKNPLPNELYNSFLVVGDTVIPIGDFEGMERIKLDYKLDSNLKSTGDFNYLSTINKVADLENYQKILFKYYFYNLADYSHNAKLIGFSKNSSEIQVNKKTQPVKQISLEVFDLELDYGEEKVHLPAGIIKPVVDFQYAMLNHDERREHILNKGEVLDIHYFLPDNISSEKINIAINADSGVVSLQAYNQVENHWQTLKSDITGESQINLVDDIVKLTTNGYLKLRVTGNSRIVLPQISLNGVYVRE